MKYITLHYSYEKRIKRFWGQNLLKQYAKIFLFGGLYAIA